MLQIPLQVKHAMSVIAIFLAAFPKAVLLGSTMSLILSGFWMWADEVQAAPVIRNGAAIGVLGAIITGFFGTVISIRAQNITMKKMDDEARERAEDRKERMLGMEMQIVALKGQVSGLEAQKVDLTREIQDMHHRLERHSEAIKGTRQVVESNRKVAETNRLEIESMRGDSGIHRPVEGT